MTIIVVGNGPSVLKNKFGGFIDSFDEVVRINHYKPIKQFVGEKVTHFYSSALNKFFYDRIPLLVSPIYLIYNYRTPATHESIYHKYPNININGFDYFEELKEYGFDIFDYARPSSGIITLLHLIKTNKYKEIVIYGFDNLVVGEQLHYFEETIYKIKEKSHHANLEKAFIEINIANGKLKRLETFISESLLNIPKILCIIPARSGSKSLPNKNIML